LAVSRGNRTKFTGFQLVPEDDLQACWPEVEEEAKEVHIALQTARVSPKCSMALALRNKIAADQTLKE